MPKILANLKFKKTHCGDCRLVWRAYNDWIDEYCIKHCPLFEQPIGGRIRCPACLEAEKAAKQMRRISDYHKIEDLYFDEDERKN